MNRRFHSAVLISAAIILAGSVPYTRVRLEPPLRFLLIGDSLMQGYFGFMLEKRLRETPGGQVLTERFLDYISDEFRPVSGRQ